MNKISDALVLSAFSAGAAFAAMEFDNHTQESVVPQKIACYAGEIASTEECVAAIDESYQAQYIGIQTIELAGIGGAIYGGIAAIRISRKQSQLHS